MNVVYQKCSRSLGTVRQISRLARKGIARIVYGDVPNRLCRRDSYCVIRPEIWQSPCIRHCANRCMSLETVIGVERNLFEERQSMPCIIMSLRISHVNTPVVYWLLNLSRFRLVVVLIQPGLCL